MQRDGTPKSDKSSLYPILFVINDQRQVAAIKAIQAEYKIKQEIYKFKYLYHLNF
jgi:hypothetical protein